MGDIYQSKSSFRAETGGQMVTVRRGDTIREGHPLLVKHPESFKLLVPRFEYEAPAPPPAPEPKPTPAAKPPSPKVPALKVPAAPKKADEEA